MMTDCLSSSRSSDPYSTQVYTVTIRLAESEFQIFTGCRNCCRPNMTRLRLDCFVNSLITLNLFRQLLSQAVCAAAQDTYIVGTMGWA